MPSPTRDEVYVAGIMEHIEEAGIHSGDSACSLPPYSLDRATIAEIERQTIALARALDVVGLMNVQFAVKDGEVYVLEVNPRASRTVPFVAKATGVPIAKIAARVMAGESLASLLPEKRRSATTRNASGHVAVKEAVFPFARFPGVDLILGPEMRSTGEVMGLDADFGRAFAKSQLGSGIDLPLRGLRLRLGARERQGGAGRTVPSACGLGLRAGRDPRHRAQARRGGSAGANRQQGAGRPPHIVDEMRSFRVQLVFNTTEGAQAIADSFSLRRTALTHDIPYYTTVAGVRAAVQAIGALRQGCLEVAPLQSYL